MPVTLRRHNGFSLLREMVFRLKTAEALFAKLTNRVSVLMLHENGLLEQFRVSRDAEPLFMELVEGPFGLQLLQRSIDILLELRVVLSNDHGEVVGGSDWREMRRALSDGLIGVEHVVGDGLVINHRIGVPRHHIENGVAHMIEGGDFSAGNLLCKLH